MISSATDASLVAVTTAAGSPAVGLSGVGKKEERDQYAYSVITRIAKDGAV